MHEGNHSIISPLTHFEFLSAQTPIARSTGSPPPFTTLHFSNCQSFVHEEAHAFPPAKPWQAALTSLALAQFQGLSCKGLSFFLTSSSPGSKVSLHLGEPPTCLSRASDHLAASVGSPHQFHFLLHLLLFCRQLNLEPRAGTS